MSRPAISSATSNDFLPRGRQIACGFASGIQPQRLPRGLTLIELLIATTLSLLMMGAVVTVFAMVSSSISDSRATMLMTDRLRSAVLLLQQDLGGATAVPMTPPLQPDKQQGYFEILQGVTGVSNTSSSDKNPFSTTNNVFVDKSNNSAVAPAPNGQTPDATCGDSGDVLMFTSRIPNSPFTGRCGLTTSGQVNYIQ
jgi:type II secretory pathway pseudopilin PulG